MKGIEPIDMALLEKVSRLAAASPRLRRNHNFHASEADGCNRLLNAIEPGSYVRPHCHLDAAKDETLLILCGKLGVLEFDSAGKLSATAELEPAGQTVGINVPHGTFHSVVALAPGTVFFEAKAGPYTPLLPSELAHWAPEEGGTAAAHYLEWMCRRFD